MTSHVMLLFYRYIYYNFNDLIALIINYLMHKCNTTIKLCDKIIRCHECNTNLSHNFKVLSIYSIAKFHQLGINVDFIYADIKEMTE